jgi:hypothetical protein
VARVYYAVIQAMHYDHRRDFVTRHSLIFILGATLFTACHKEVADPANSQTMDANVQSDVPYISENEAKNHIGQYVVVSGMVTGFYANRQTTNVYLYFDSDDIAHPKFAVLWSGTNNPPVTALKSLILNAKTVSVSGRIILESNMPEIKINSQTQIKIN